MLQGSDHLELSSLWFLVYCLLVLQGSVYPELLSLWFLVYRLLVLQGSVHPVMTLISSSDTVLVDGVYAVLINITMPPYSFTDYEVCLYKHCGVYYNRNISSSFLYCHVKLIKLTSLKLLFNE